MRACNRVTRGAGGHRETPDDPDTCLDGIAVNEQSPGRRWACVADCLATLSFHNGRSKEHGGHCTHHLERALKFDPGDAHEDVGCFNDFILLRTEARPEIIGSVFDRGSTESATVKSAVESWKG